MRVTRPSSLVRWIFAVLAGGWAATCLAAIPPAAFDAANKLYEEGKFVDAAAAYQALLHSNAPSASLYFNLGNARYKAGQLGRAIAAYRSAERLAPRDPSVRFNLRFVRQKVTGSDAPVSVGWERWLRALTLNEWTLLASGALWGCCVLLGLGEVRPAWRRGLRNYVLLTSGAAVMLGAGLLLARRQAQAVSAVVVVRDAVVRYGPLAESQVFFQLRDGSEMTVLEQKEVSSTETWLKVQEAAGRSGWVKRDQVAVLNY